MLISFSNLKKGIHSSNRYPEIVLITLSLAHFLDDGLILGFSTLLLIIKEELSLNYLDVSLVEATRSAINAIGNPLMGWISDKTGKRKLLFIIGIFGSSNSGRICSFRDKKT